MTPDVALDVLQRESAAFADLLVDGALDSPVPGCPGWSLLHLAHHLGGIHRWARHAVLVGPSQKPAGPDDPADVAPWFREGAAELVDTLRGRSPDQPCWTFASPSTVRFWLRRQAHETTLHRWDAETACGVDTELDDAVALDGLDEVATMILPHQVRLGRFATTDGAVELVAPSGARTLLTTDVDSGPRAPVASVTGPAGALLLLVWKRLDLRDPRLEVTGDVDAAQRFLDGSITP